MPGLHFPQIVHTLWFVHIAFDPGKNEQNLRERGLSFEEAACFEFESALVHVDDRQEYGEVRYVAVGLLRDRLHVLCFTEVPDGIRVISFRRANDREVSRYAKSQATD